jgi:N,N'-diacetylchitobiose transport system substrate-binding protein
MTRQSRALAGALTLTLAATLAACSGSSTSSPSASSSGGSYAGQTLTVWIMEGTNPDMTPFFKDVSATFLKETGAKLDVQIQPWKGAHDKFTTAIAGGTTPDVAEVGTTWTPEFADAGALIDLTDRVKQAGLTDDLVPGLVEAGTLDGKLYGMPWYSGVRAFIYRTDLFQQAGLSVPTNWTELKDTAVALKKAYPDVTAFPIAGDSTYAAMPFIWGAGGEIATLEGKKWVSGLDSAKSRAGLEYYSSLASKDGVSTAAAATWTEEDTLKAFEQGSAAMIISGSWTPKLITTDAPDLAGKIGAFPIPGQDGGISGSFLGGSHLGIFTASKKQDLAWEFVKLMTTGEYAQRWADETNYFPGQTSLLDKVIAANDPLVAPFAEQVSKGGRSLPVTPLWGAVEGAKTQSVMLQSIISGQATVDQATTKAATEMNSIFNGS